MSLQPDRLSFLPCEGGCDFVTPPLQQKPGRLRICMNMEVGVNGGYDTIRGYERFDGRAAPSDATYQVLPATITGSIEAGDTVTGDTSGATGTVIAIDSQGPIVTQVSGTFVDGEDLLVSAVVEATMTDDPIPRGAPTPKLHSVYLNLAADVYRALIQAVPGEGPIRGICRYNSVLYAWRNNVGSTAMAIYKSTTGGWSLVALGREIAFTSGGTYEIEIGNTITGATSGATAVITNVVLQSGTFASGDAAGYLVFASQTGTFQSENLNVGANLNVATIAGNSSAITLLPNGRVKHFIHNFGGGSTTRKIYGCDGVNPGFEFDGTVYTKIRTGMTDDKPENVICHKQHLFFSFGASVQHSATTLPYSWSPVLGAGEIGVGDDVTGFSIEMGSEANAALGIMSRNAVHVLYGNDDGDWNLVRYRDEIGAFENSIQNIGITITLDDRGITSFRSSQDFGNFLSATLSQLVQPWIQERKDTVTDTCIVRTKNQLRYFFEDKTALYVTFSNRKVLGMMTQLLPHKITCMHSVEGTTAEEEIFFGSDDGHCYQMEVGTSFDGEPIESFALMQYVNQGQARVNKRYKSASIEVGGSGYTELGVGYEIGYGSVNFAQPNSYSSFTGLNFDEARWDSFIWDNFYWDSEYVSPLNLKLTGATENIGFIFHKSSDEHLPTKVSGILIRYQDGRILR